MSTKQEEGSRPFLSIFGISMRTMDGRIERVAAAACRAGYAIVPVEPEGKRPICPLTARDRNTAEAAAHAQGLKHHRCGVHHAITDPKVAERVFKRLRERYAPDMVPNIGVVAGPSRLIIVDCDTDAQTADFLADWHKATGDDGVLTRTPTVTTPGLMGDGTLWIHKNGGHYYFSLPAGTDIGESRDVIKMGSYDIKVGWSQCLVPPSLRAEGPYECWADVPEAPAWLIEAVKAKASDWRERMEYHRSVTVNDSVAEWSNSLTWAELVTPYGWTEAGKTDGCGCPIFTKPGGGRTSYKSATAHDDTCPQWENAEGHGPLHLWTSEPPEELAPYVADGVYTFTKLQFAAIMEHQGDVDAAMSALGLTHHDEQWAEEMQALIDQPAHLPTEEEGTDTAVSTVPTLMQLVAEVMARYGMVTEPEHVKEVASKVRKEAQGLVAKVAAQEWLALMTEQASAGLETSWTPRDDLASVLAALGSEMPAEGLLRRVDGALLFLPGKVNVVFGQSESGKSWLTLLTIMQKLAAGGSCLYVDMEDSAETFLKRLITMGFDPLPAIRDERLKYVSPTEAPSLTMVGHVPDYDLVVIDSMSEIIANIDAATNMDGSMVKRVFRVLRAWAARGACVIIIDHASEKVDSPTSTLGASEKRQAVDGVEVLVRNVIPLSKTTGGKSNIYITKDREGSTSGDVEMVHGHQVSKAHRRPWGTLTFTPDDAAKFLSGLDRTIVQVTKPDPEPVPEDIKVVAERRIMETLDEAAPEAVPTVRFLVSKPDDISTEYVRLTLDSMTAASMIHIAYSRSTPGKGGRPTTYYKKGRHPTESGEEFI